MRVTPSHVLASQNLGRIVSAFLTLILAVQPIQVRAQTVTNLDTGERLTAPADALGIDQGQENAQAGPTKPPTVQEVLLDVCGGHGYGEDCAKALLGMMWKESQNEASAIGDHGLALGYFQIHFKLHRVSRDCAKDLHCSAEWTLKYMESNGYPKYPTYAIQCHNGCGIKNGYAASVLRHARRLWQEPMTVEVAVAK